MIASPVFFQKDLTDRGEVVASSAVEGHDTVLDAMLANRRDCYDWHVAAEDIEARVAEESRGVFLVSRPHLSVNSDHRIYLDDHSRRQFCDSLSLPLSVVAKLQKDGNLSLLADNMNHYLRTGSREEYLLRLRAAEGVQGRPVHYNLRAFLPATYNRLDSIYLLSGIRAACEKHDLQWKNLYYDLDHFTCHLMRQGRKRLLRKKGEEFISGIAIENSEIGHLYGGDSFVARIYFERLVCTNGMTTSHSVNLRIKNPPNLTTNYPNVLPPFPIKRELQKSIDAFLTDEIIGRLMGGIAGGEEWIQKSAEKLSGISIKVLSHAHAREIVRGILMRSGMLFTHGVRLDGVLESLMIPIGIYDPPVARIGEPFPNSLTAWDFYNALTQYATNLMMARGTERNVRLGGRVSRQSHRIFSDDLDWSRISRRAEKAAKKPRTKVEVPTV